MPMHGGGCVFAADCKYAARRRDDADPVAIAYGDCVRRVFGDCSRQLHIRLLLAVFRLQLPLLCCDHYAVIATHD